MTRKIDKPFKAGDVVTLFCRGDIQRIRRVERTTKTLVIVENEKERFRTDGEKITSDPFYHGCIEHTTDEHRALIRRHNALHWLRSFDWNRIPDGDLFRVHGIIMPFLAADIAAEKMKQREKESGRG
jgi:hypothetical protein